MYLVFVSIAPFFMVMLVGFIFTKINLVTIEWTKILNLFALRVGFPTLIFTSLATSDISIIDNWELILANSLYLLFCFASALLISKVFGFSKKLKQTLFLIFPFGNIAYLGMPVLNEIYGPKVLTQVSLVVGLHLFWLFTFGIYYLEKKKNGNSGIVDTLKNLGKNPLLIAVLAGMGVSFVNFPADNLVFKTTALISKSATPVVLFSIGIFISQIKIGSVRNWIGISAYSITKLLVLPAIFLLVLSLFKLDTLPFKLSVVEASMPLALTPYALSQEYDMDGSFITKSIVLTTILSIFSIPFWVVWLQ